MLPGVPAMRTLEPAIELVLHPDAVEDLHRIHDPAVGEVRDVAVVQAQQRGAVVDGIDIEIRPVTGIAGGEDSDVAELTRSLSEDAHRLPATHGQPGKCTPLRLGTHVQLLLSSGGNV